MALDSFGEVREVSYKLPDAADVNEDEVTISVEGLNSVWFAEFDSESKTILFKDYGPEDEGIYSLTVVLTDEHAMETKYVINIAVLQLTEPEPEPVEEEVVVEEVEIQEINGVAPQKAKVLSMNQFGEVIIKFTQDIDPLPILSLNSTASRRL